MAKNKHVDLFKDIIPCVDQGIKELWDAVTDEGRAEIKADLWNLNRYISSVAASDQEIQEHYLLVVNNYYNKNWASISKHPKLQWLILAACSHHSKTKQFHEWIPLKKEKNKKEEFLATIFPTMKRADIATLAAITTDREIKDHCQDLGWDKKQVNAIKF